MQCELCGTDIHGEPRKVIIEGTELSVCNGCAQYGHEVKQISRTKPTPTPRTQSAGRRGPAPGITFRAPSRRRPDMFDQMTDELVDGYGMVIRHAREASGMTHEDLAREIKEKSSLLKKIEREAIVPEDSVRGKLERALKITLTEIPE
ncbi:MAG: TIGR00270 family protein [Methanosarcinales archaeon]|nr:MAG: TIGR00270 family protein [Methanosarcinales archaeon]